MKGLEESQRSHCVLVPERGNIIVKSNCLWSQLRFLTCIGHHRLGQMMQHSSALYDVDPDSRTAILSKLWALNHPEFQFPLYHLLAGCPQQVTQCLQASAFCSVVIVPPSQSWEDKMCVKHPMLFRHTKSVQHILLIVLQRRGYFSCFSALHDQKCGCPPSTLWIPVFQLFWPASHYVSQSVRNLYLWRARCIP